MFRSSSCVALLFALLVGCWQALVTAGVRADEDERQPGLIGSAVKDGEATKIGYQYPHGEVFPAELIRSRFHDGEKQLPSVRIELVGMLDVPEEMDVDVFHAAGGVNGDHGTLYLDDRRVGQVGDDTVKVVIYSLTLPKGQHRVRWVLTGGLFRPNLLKFQDADNGELLRLYHTGEQREATGADKARVVIQAAGKVEGWPPAPNAWTRVASELK